MSSAFQSFDLSSVPASLKGGALAIGNFDGMHRGHQAVLGAAIAAGDRIGVPAIGLTFEPHPRDVFRPDHAVFRLTPPSVKARLAEAIGLKAMVSIHFDSLFAAMTPEEFVKSVLVDQLAIRYVAIGWNFHFGSGRRGTPTLLAELGARYGFDVEIIEPFETEDGFTVSSSAVRDRLSEGNIAEAAGLLGWRWFFEGVVVDGDKRGRTIGFPTANIRLPEQVRLGQGIYAVFADFDGTRHAGVASWGRRPTFDNGNPVFETFVFDYAGDLYGKTLAITPVSYLRPEMKFDGIAALVAQMNRDAEEGRQILNAFDQYSPLDLALRSRMS
ncbi:bifunctional riboflavin kinase/FAD synthetase [Oryzibacter oryziterrae]|uniref:bifunctional riboflavin kinase/FAD synthetase n=1 Tax=Oryzibacter oryziterrae TaxID=2766474 RepID=UPI001EFF6789|nr:bifunctional riboflavin kinase/FAD synthetase [Oryzibacter oryziterrae]